MTQPYPQSSERHGRRARGDARQQTSIVDWATPRRRVLRMGAYRSGDQVYVYNPSSLIEWDTRDIRAGRTKQAETPQ